MLSPHKPAEDAYLVTPPSIGRAIKTNTDKGWLQTIRTVPIAARTSFTQRSPTCAALRPKVTSCQASSNVFNIVDSAYPGIANGNGTFAIFCSCVFKNTGTAAATAMVRCGAYCAP
jgi:hypothetical protein